MGAGVSAMTGFRWVFLATALVVLINTLQLGVALHRTAAKRRQMR